MADKLILRAWLSLVERLVRDQEAGGSNPLAPTISLLQDFEVTKRLSVLLAQVLVSAMNGSGVSQQRKSLCPAIEQHQTLCQNNL